MANLRKIKPVGFYVLQWVLIIVVFFCGIDSLIKLELKKIDTIILPLKKRFVFFVSFCNIRFYLFVDRNTVSHCIRINRYVNKKYADRMSTYH